MKETIKKAISISIQDFRLPRYEEIPDVGFYLEQTVKYINNYLTPLDNSSLTGSMISNYVKKKLIDNPIKKQYYRDHVAYLIFIAVAKSVLSMDNIFKLIEMQNQTYPNDVAYNYFCQELENILQYVFGLKEVPGADDDMDASDEKVLLRNIIITVAHKIYLEKSFDFIREDTKKTSEPV